MVHAFEITQKLDKIVLEAAALLLGIRVCELRSHAVVAEPQLRVKRTYFTAYADSAKDIANIISFFHNTMKGMKSLEYRI